MEKTLQQNKRRINSDSAYWNERGQTPLKSLTAAVNSFNKEGVTSAQVINRMAKVDAEICR